MSSEETEDRVVSLEKQIAYLQKENNELKSQVEDLKAAAASPPLPGGGLPDQLFFKDVKTHS